MQKRGHPVPCRAVIGVGANSGAEEVDVFEICVIVPSRRSSLLKCATLFEAQQTAREAALVTGRKVEIVNRQTG